MVRVQDRRWLDHVIVGLIYVVFPFAQQSTSLTWCSSGMFVRNVMRSRLHMHAMSYLSYLSKLPGELLDPFSGPNSCSALPRHTAHASVPRPDRLFLNNSTCLLLALCVSVPSSFTHPAAFFTVSAILPRRSHASLLESQPKTLSLSICTCLSMQVKQVYNVGLNADGFGRQLTALFRQAVTAGKRVRSETSIASGAVSVSSAAAELAQLKLPSHNWADAKVINCVSN